MDDPIITLQELLEHQRQDIASLSEELYAQQKEIALLKKQLLKLNDKMQALGNSQGAANPTDEPPPPHY